MKIMLVGEAFGEREAEVGMAFVGPSGSVLNGLLRQVGLFREECVITNVFNLRPQDNQIESLMTSVEADRALGWPTYAPKVWIHRDYSMSLYELTELRKAVNPNVIVALGDTALWALTHQRGIKKYRGTPLPTFDGFHKVIATWHPAAILRQWELRPVAYLDLVKAKAQSAFPEIRRPQRIVTLAPTIDDIARFYVEHIRPAPFISVDTETAGRQITEVGIATSPSRALVIPFFTRATQKGNYWPTLREEEIAWGWVRRIMTEKKVIGQNFQYDMTYFWRTMHIPSPGFIGDTMLLHHAMQPELEKSLGFLGSIYTDEPAWKFMRKDVETLKKED